MMNILDNELGKNRIRDSNFLKEKFEKYSDYFIVDFKEENLGKN